MDDNLWGERFIALLFALSSHVNWHSLHVCIRHPWILSIHVNRHSLRVCIRHPWILGSHVNWRLLRVCIRHPWNLPGTRIFLMHNCPFLPASLFPYIKNFVPNSQLPHLIQSKSISWLSSFTDFFVPTLRILYQLSLTSFNLIQISQLVAFAGLK